MWSQHFYHMQMLRVTYFNDSLHLTFHIFFKLFRYKIQCLQSTLKNWINILFIHINVSYVIEFLAWWVLKSKVFAQKSTVVKWNYCILWVDIEWGLQKLGLNLESKVVRKLSLEKNVFNKKWSPKLIFLDDFFLEKFGWFLT